MIENGAFGLLLAHMGLRGKHLCGTFQLAAGYDRTIDLGDGISGRALDGRCRLGCDLRIRFGFFCVATESLASRKHRKGKGGQQLRIRELPGKFHCVTPCPWCNNLVMIAYERPL